jgi:hypothetical protein
VAPPPPKGVAVGVFVGVAVEVEVGVAVGGGGGVSSDIWREQPASNRTPLRMMKLKRNKNRRMGPSTIFQDRWEG